MAASSSGGPVHQLWPPSKGNQRTELDVVLFHGLQFTETDTSDAWRSTWTQRGPDGVCWPEEWLPDDLGKAVRILSVSYNAHVKDSPHGHVKYIAHNVYQTLTSPSYEWLHPIVLIGHSFGGLVLKSLVAKLKTVESGRDDWSEGVVRRGKAFLSNVRGVVFYAVPHIGSKNFYRYVKKLVRRMTRHQKLRRKDRHPAGIVKNIRPGKRDMADLSVRFQEILTGNNINIYAFCETSKMKKGEMLVDVSSAQQLAGDSFSEVDGADHMEVCKPPSKKHCSYVLLLQFIQTCQKVPRECDPSPVKDISRGKKRNSASLDEGRIATTHREKKD